MVFNPDTLSNTYFVLRHGKSKANEEEIIVSDPEAGIAGYGLTAAGKDEVLASVKKAREENMLDESVVIVSSDFQRTKETAELAASVLHTKELIFTPKLRERYFGGWDRQHNSNYQRVWDEDARDHTHTVRGVESVADVLARAMSLIEDLEKKYSSRKILLVSHGDTLQILQTAFKAAHPSTHRSLDHLKTAEIRRLN